MGEEEVDAAGLLTAGQAPQGFAGDVEGVELQVAARGLQGGWGSKEKARAGGSGRWAGGRRGTACCLKERSRTVGAGPDHVYWVFLQQMLLQLLPQLHV